MYKAPRGPIWGQASVHAHEPASPGTHEPMGRVSSPRAVTQNGESDTQPQLLFFPSFITLFVTDIFLLAVISKRLH